MGSCIFESRILLSPPPPTTSSRNIFRLHTPPTPTPVNESHPSPEGGMFIVLDANSLTRVSELQVLRSQTPPELPSLLSPKEARGTIVRTTLHFLFSSFKTREASLANSTCLSFSNFFTAVSSSFSKLCADRGTMNLKT